MHHGGRLADACALFGGHPGDWLDLSTGINPQPWPVASAGAVDWAALPDATALARLEQSAAAFYGAAPSLCAAIPGSETGLRQLARILALPGLHQSLAYGTYRSAFARSDVADDLSHLPQRASVLVVGNPNNPDGRLLSRDAMAQMLRHQERNDGWLVIDEAFADCDPAWSLASEVTPKRRLIVLRSFGKFFGLAGLRLGFAIAPPPILAALREGLGDWPIHSAALAHATEAFADTAWIAATRCNLSSQARSLDHLLERHGLVPEGACPLFRLVRGSGAGELFHPLAQRAILTRPFADHPDLLRLGLPADDCGLRRLDVALTEVRGLHG